MKRLSETFDLHWIKYFYTYHPSSLINTISRSIYINISCNKQNIVTGLRLVAAGEGMVIAASKWGKAKTISQLTAIILLLLNNFPFTYLGIPMDVIILYLALVLTIISGADYIIKNYHILSSGDR